MPDLSPIFSAIIDKGGLLGALLLLSVAGNVFFIRRLLISEGQRVAEGKAWATAQEEVSSERLKDAERMTLALERSAVTSLTLTTSSEAMVKTLGTLMEVRRHDSDALGRIEADLTVLRDRYGVTKRAPA